MKKEEISKIVQVKKDNESRALRENHPPLYWAKHYHRNSRGEPMDFTNVPYLLDLYMLIYHNPYMVVEKSVQCGLSELFIIQSHVEAANGLSIMYCLPKYELRNRFVNNRIYKLHRRVAKYSALIREGSTGGIHRTSLVHFGKGTIAYVGSNVESEFIEMPVDSAFVDEKDRCNLENLHLLADRYSASPYKFHREISNPTVEGFGIDERFQESSQGLWNIQCEHCNKWFTPDFFRNVVRQTGPRIYVPKDPSYDPEDEEQEIKLVCECGKVVENRLKEGEWVHKYPKKKWKGYRISKIFNKHASLRELYDKFMKAQGNDLLVQIFYNSDLGLPYTAKGAKVTTDDLNRCKRDYMVRPGESSTNVRVIGVDVGVELHYIVRDIVKEQNVPCRRLLEAGTVPTFELLEEIIKTWNPRIIVIDALPEIHKVMDLKSKFKNVYSSVFSENKRTIGINKENKEVQMDRTAILDAVKQSIVQETFLLPRNAEFLDNGQYYSMMTAATRILSVDENNPEKSRYEWVHSSPDHYFLAEAYALQAMMLLPNFEEVMEFFKSSTPSMKPEISDIKGLTEEQAKELDRLSRITSESFLGGLQKNYAKKNKGK